MPFFFLFLMWSGCKLSYCKLLSCVFQQGSDSQTVCPVSPLCMRDKDRDRMTTNDHYEIEGVGGLREDYFLFMTSLGVCESCKAASLLQTRRCKQCIPCGEPGINGNNLFRTDTGPVTHMALSKTSHY